MKTVSAIIKRLMQEEPYYGIYACGLNKEFNDQIQTAGVCLDGINYKLLINKDWWYKLPFNYQYGVIKHELLHLVFYHPVDSEMWEALMPDHNLLNIAMDLEVQSYIDQQYRWPECTAEQLFKEFPNLPRRMGTKFYIEFVKQIQKYDPNKGGDPGPYGSNNTNWGKVRDMLNNPDSQHQNWNTKDLSDAKKDLIKGQLEFQAKEVAKNTEKSRGMWPAELQEMLEKLLKPEPPVFNWKSYFRRRLGIAFDIYQKKTRRKESERFEGSPGLKRKKKHSLLVAIDTSGSVSQSELQDFFSEIYHIWKAGANVHILECDASIKREYDYDGKTPEYISGRGGTAFTPCVDYYNEHRKDYTTMVYFTDGFGDQEACKPKNQMMWVITSQGNSDDNFPGITIRIPVKK